MRLSYYSFSLFFLFFSNNVKNHISYRVPRYLNVEENKLKQYKTCFRCKTTSSVINNARKEVGQCQNVRMIFLKMAEKIILRYKVSVIIICIPRYRDCQRFGTYTVIKAEIKLADRVGTTNLSNALFKSDVFFSFSQLVNFTCFVNAVMS